MGQKELLKYATMTAESHDEGGDEEFRSLWAELGLPEPEFLDESRAPPVNRELIEKLMRNELPRKAADEVYGCIVLFQSWSDAHKQVVDEELRRRAGQG